MKTNSEAKKRGPVTISFTTLIRKIKKREILAWRESCRELTSRRKTSRPLQASQDCHEIEALSALLRRMTAHGLVRNSAWNSRYWFVFYFPAILFFLLFTASFPSVLSKVQLSQSAAKQQQKMGLSTQLLSIWSRSVKNTNRPRRQPRARTILLTPVCLHDLPTALYLEIYIWEKKTKNKQSEARLLQGS